MQELVVGSPSEVEGEQDVAEPRDDDWSTEIPSELSTDSDWSDTYQDMASSGAGAEGPDLDRNAISVSLHDHLAWQLAMADVDEFERQIAESLIDAVAPSGYLEGSLDELTQGLRSQGLDGLKASDVERVLLRLQQFEPTGIFARDLRECLLLQLGALPADTPLLPQAKRLTRQFLEALAADDRKLLKRRLRLDDEQLGQVTFDGDGLVPAIVQEEHTGRILMMAWMNEASLRETMATGRTWFWSRSRQEYWCKGETSGDRQYVREAFYDCDGDTLLFVVEQEGRGACHTGEYSCFFRAFGLDDG